MNDIHQLDYYLAPDATELYRDPSEIDMSVLTKSFIMVLGIWVNAILGESKGIYIVLIDKGVEANLISESRALALGLLITKGQFMNLNGASASINMIGIYQKVRVDVFGIVF
jgi:hypothetical protein